MIDRDQISEPMLAAIEYHPRGVSTGRTRSGIIRELVAEALQARAKGLGRQALSRKEQGVPRQSSR